MSKRVRNRAVRWVIGVAVLLAVTSALAESRVDCGKLQSKVLGRAVPYCVMLPSSYDESVKTTGSASVSDPTLRVAQGGAPKGKRYPILYYLHGLGDNEQSLVNGGGWNLYERMLEEKKIGEYIIATPYGYRSFYINARDGKFAYEDFFVKEFMPAMERKYRVRAGRASRGIMGVSMGGYGAFHYAFKYPERFVSVSAHMAAFMEDPPANLGGTREGRLLGDVFGNPLDKQYYQRNSPFSLARTRPAATLNRLAIYFDVGRNDGYGFDAGNTALSNVLNSRGVKHEFHVFPGGHDWSFVVEHFGKSLEWHGEAFSK